MSDAWIHGYGCTSAAGPSTADFWKSLQNGVDHSRAVPVEGVSGARPASVRVCQWRDDSSSSATARERLGAHMLIALQGALDQLESSSRRRVLASKHLGVILASAKGFVDDCIESDAIPSDDALSLLLRDFLARSGLTAARTLAVSNACASSLSALFLARNWLKTSDLCDVVVIAAERIGPFIAGGFHALRAVTPDKARPFSAERNGLQLGEAAAAILLSSMPGPFALDGAAINAGGPAVTCPLQTGDSLERACLGLPNIRTTPPDLIIAHGTATRVNDPIEDRVFSNIFGDTGASPLITGSKWCIGHTLGASGAMDVIAACEVMKHQRVFRIANTARADPAFSGRYLSADSEEQPGRLRRVLITSLGFGGIQAAASVSIP